MTGAALFLAVFLACAVEAVEALTITLAAGTSRDWRSALTGVSAACVVVCVPDELTLDLHDLDLVIVQSSHHLGRTMVEEQRQFLGDIHRIVRQGLSLAHSDCAGDPTSSRHMTLFRIPFRSPIANREGCAGASGGHWPFTGLNSACAT